MTWRLPRSFLWRLALAFITAQLVVSLGLGWFTHRRVRDFQLEQRLHQLQRLTTLQAGRCADLLTNDQLDALRLSLTNDGQQIDTRFTLIAPDGRILTDSHEAGDPAASDAPEVRAARETGSGSDVRRRGSEPGLMMYYARRLDLDNPDSPILRSALPLSVISAELADLGTLMLLASALSIILLMVIFLLLGRYFGRQITALATGAARFASGDLKYRVERPSARELALLADGLNQMAGQLNARIAQLQSQQTEQQAILQSMSNGVIALDLQHRVLIMNRAAERMLGVRPGSARGRLLQEVARQPELLQFVAHALEHDDHLGPTDSSGFPSEFPIRGPDSRLIVQIASESLTGPDGERKGLLIVLNDVTQIRRLESVRTDFAANVSHELRTPITNIMGYIETLQQVGWDDPEQAGRFLDIIRRNSSRLAAIVEDVLALARLEQPGAREALERKPADLAEIARAALAQFEQAAAEKQIRVVPRLQPGLTALVHTQLLEQAVGNLLSNAIRYSPAESEIIVAVRPGESGRGLIEVIDHGVGIPPDQLPRLFERFYRVDKARSRAMGGTGLGLAIVKHITLLHGGEVDVESTVGRGSTFRILIPLESSPEDHDSSAETPFTAPESGTR